MGPGFESLKVHQKRPESIGFRGVFCILSREPHPHTEQSLRAAASLRMSVRTRLCAQRKPPEGAPPKKSIGFRAFFVSFHENQVAVLKKEKKSYRSENFSLSISSIKKAGEIAEYPHALRPFLFFSDNSAFSVTGKTPQRLPRNAARLFCKISRPCAGICLCALLASYLMNSGMNLSLYVVIRSAPSLPMMYTSSIRKLPHSIPLK